MNFKDLRIWQESLRLSIQINKRTKQFPPEEKFGLTSQINRCAVSIPSNIAEGYGRNSRPDFARFCNIAKGSANELETQIYIANELGYISSEETKMFITTIQSIIKQISVFHTKLVSS